MRVVCRPGAITLVSDDDVSGRRLNLVAHFKVHLIPHHANDRIRIAWNRPPRPTHARRERYAAELREALRTGHRDRFGGRRACA